MPLHARRAAFVLAIVAMLSLGCRAEFDIERDVTAAGNENLIVEQASDARDLEADDDASTGSIDLDDLFGDGEEGLDLDLGEGGSFSFDVSGGDEEGFIPTGPGTDPERDMSWNTDPDSVLQHLGSIAPPERNLAFEWKTVAISDDESVTGPFPVGWEISEPFLGIDLEPGDGYDFFTDAEIDAGCQGSCMPQDWGALMDNPEMSPFRSDPAATTVVLHDLASIPGEAPAGRMLVTTDPESSFSPAAVTVTRWSDEASHFLWCAVSLDEGDVDLWPVMADMCAAMRPDWMS